jgi:dephospho-CoA kinase
MTAAGTASASASGARRGSPYVVGLTGGIGSGKSTVASLFEQRGAGLVDTDALAHALTAQGGAAMPAIVARFGAQAARADGSLDRAWMRERAFADATQRRALEAILHPMIRREVEAAIAVSTAPYLLVAVPLLTERAAEPGSWRSRMSRILVVDCSLDRQIERVMRRSGLTREQVMAIVAAQASREQRLALADDVLDNDGAPEALAPQVEALHQQYLRFAQASPMSASDGASTI